MPDYIENMAYAAETQTPWHGLGATLSPNASLERWIGEAGLNWKTVPLPVLVQGRERTKVAEGYQALVRSDNGDILDIVSSQYKPIQNSKMMSLMREFMEGIGVEMETAGSLKGGRVVWALGKIPTSGLTVNGDWHEAFVLVSTGHESGFAFQAQPTGMRVVCHNTLMFARGQESSARFRHNHRSRFTAQDAKDAYEIVSAGVLGLEQYAAQLERMQKISMGQEETQRYVLELLQPHLLAEAVREREIPIAGRQETGKGLLDQMLTERMEIDPERFNRPVKSLLDAIVEQPGAQPGTLANAFNGVTYYVDHRRGRSRDSGLAAAWFGEGARLKQKAYDLAGNIAEVSAAGAGRRAA